MNLPFSLTVLLAAAAIPMAASAADLAVTVSGGPATAATLYVALFDSADAMAADTPVASQTLPMRDGAARLSFIGLAPGRYALKSFADENRNGKLDRSLVGMPTERYGFSNDATGSMGPPAFDAAAVLVEADSSIALRQR